MASEILAVPEECLVEVVKVIRAGIIASSLSEEVKEQLTKWCDEEEEYINRE